MILIIKQTYQYEWPKCPLKYMRLKPMPSPAFTECTQSRFPDLNSLCLYHPPHHRGCRRDREFLHLHVPVDAPVSSSLDPVWKNRQQVSITKREHNNLHGDNLLPWKGIDLIKNIPTDWKFKWLPVFGWVNFLFFMMESLLHARPFGSDTNTLL